MASENGRPVEGQGRGASVNHESEKGVLSTMEALFRARRDKAPAHVPDDDDFRGKYPKLFAWLCATQIADEFERDPAKLSLVRDGTYWRLTLMDPALEGSLSVVANTRDDAHALLESWLNKEDAPWQYFRKRGQKAVRPLERDSEEGLAKKKKKK